MHKQQLQVRRKLHGVRSLWRMVLVLVLGLVLALVLVLVLVLIWVLVLVLPPHCLGGLQPVLCFRQQLLVHLLLVFQS